jgi:hypothetical protein
MEARRRKASDDRQGNGAGARKLTGFFVLESVTPSSIGWLNLRTVEILYMHERPTAGAFPRYLLKHCFTVNF